MIKDNALKRKIKNGQPVLGTWNTMASTVVSEVLATAGLDYVIVDCEHGAFDLSTINNYINAIAVGGSNSIIRIPDNKEWMALQIFDQGADGIMVPHIDDAPSAKTLVKASKYYPQGERGFSPFTKSGGYTNVDKQHYAAFANKNSITSIIIESLEGMNNIDEILETDDLDIVYIGAYDLSQALGVPGDVKNRKVIQAIKSMTDKISSAGKCPGAFVAKNKDDIKWALDIGLRFIPYQVDCGILFDNVNGISNWFKGETI